MTGNANDMLALELRSLPFLQSLAPEQMEPLIRKMHPKHLRANAPILAEGDMPSEAYLVLSGAVRIEKNTADGKQILINILGAGEIFGEMGLITGERRSASVVAHTECRLAAMDAACFSLLRTLKPEINDHLLRTLSTRLLEANERLRDVGLVPLESRLANILLHFCAHYGFKEEAGTLIDLPLTQTQLAELAACSREHVSRIFKEWERAGVVGRDGPSILVRDMARLKKISRAV